MAAAAPPAPPDAAATKAEGHGAHEKRAPGAGHVGKLSLDSIPWTEVYWKGRDLGQTPLFEVDLPAGSQQLVLKNPGESVNQTIEVEIKAGSVTSQKLHLQ